MDPEGESSTADGDAGVNPDTDSDSDSSSDADGGRDYYRQLFEEVSDAIVVYDPETAVVIEANPAAAELTGYARDVLEGAPVTQFSAGSPEAVGRAAAELVDRAAAGDQRFEWGIERADGTVRTAEVSLHRTTVDGADLVLAVMRDVTDRERREVRIDALREATLSLLAAESPGEVGHIAVRTAGDALGFPVAAMWLVDDEDDALVPVAETREAANIVGPAPHIEHGEGVFWRALERGRALRFDDLGEERDVLNPETRLRSELVVPVGDWGVFTVAATEPAAFDDEDVRVLETLAGALEAALGRLADEQLLRRRGEELRRQNEQLEEFASVVAHDVRGPLTAARGFLEMARETGTEGFYDDVERAHARMERLIDDLLTLARAGKSIAQRRPVDLAEIASLAWTGTGDADLTVEEGLPAVTGDESRLEQAFSNLFRNAVDHAGADVSVRVGPLADATGFYVEDDGPGIPPRKRPHVFEFGYTDSPVGPGSDSPSSSRCSRPTAGRWR